MQCVCVMPVSLCLFLDAHFPHSLLFSLFYTFCSFRSLFFSTLSALSPSLLLFSFPSHSLALSHTLSYLYYFLNFFLFSLSHLFPLSFHSQSHSYFSHSQPHSLAHTHTDVVGILDDTRLRHAKSVVRERFGVEAARVFHILLERKLLEEKQVCARQLYTNTHIHAHSHAHTHSRTKCHRCLSHFEDVSLIALRRDCIHSPLFFTGAYLSHLNPLLCNYFHSIQYLQTIAHFFSHLVLCMPLSSSLYYLLN